MSRKRIDEPTPPDNESDVKGPPAPQPVLRVQSLVEAVGVWEALSDEIKHRQLELEALIEGAEEIRQFLLVRYSITVPQLGASPIPVEAARFERVSPVIPSGDEPAPSSEYRPPLQQPIIDPVTTGPVSEAQIDGIRGDSALSGADPARFGHDVLGKLDAVRRAFGG